MLKQRVLTALVLLPLLLLLVFYASNPVLYAVLALAGSWYWDMRRADAEEREQAAASPPTSVDPFAGGYPVPPLPGQTLKEPSRRPVAVGGRTAEPADAHTEEDASG